ncbi:SAM-dependent methyltransferase [Rhodoferax aquaticus]|uniref:SAM-dependent methyltransferase n=1 Tax=Rhodoferax aquaticus TaxID=2527691 RepID=A0A515EVT8_9BURK|nr:SAM-dependent methyltransferase [Rhodoferax aquaticus]
MQDWFQTPPGRYLLEWEQDCIDRAVVDIFGYHALQLGAPLVDGLRANRMPHRWLGVDHSGAPALNRTLVTDYRALPFPANSVDLIVLPHTLEYSLDPHATLREVERVLVPEGRVVICGLNPASLWGLRQKRSHIYQRLGYGQLFLPAEGEFIGYWRMRDWLRLLGFEVEHGHFGLYRPSVAGTVWLERFAWMDRLGPKWWPIFGAAYFLVAIKRVRGMRLLGPAWKKTPARAGQSVSVVGRSPSRSRFEE